MANIVAHGIRVNKPLKIGESADITILGANNESQRLRTSPVETWSTNPTGSVSIRTANSHYLGMTLENPEMAMPSMDLGEALAQLSSQMEAAQL